MKLLYDRISLTEVRHALLDDSRPIDGDVRLEMEIITFF